MLKFPPNNLVILETNKFDEDNKCSYVFANPVRIISCNDLNNIEKSFLEIEDFIDKGFYAAGFLSYEAGYAFEAGLRGRIPQKSSFPFLWFGIYEKPDAIAMPAPGQGHKGFSISNFQADISKAKYIENINKIKSFIRRGETYQVNYTFKYNFNFKGSAYSLYRDLKDKQRVSYSAFIKASEWSILSFSPELFFRQNKNRIEVRPMKGTIRRGRDLIEDNKNLNTLKNCLKDRSENLMVVDLLRNDLGRISSPGAVRTVKLFEVERYETLLQMISVIKSRVKKNTKAYGLFRALFPSGSVTGAPKIRTMEIINILEKEPRNIYTGAIGFFGPKGRQAVFNVAIRTLLINNKSAKGEMGVGSGVLYDSSPEKEFEECKLKKLFVAQPLKNDFKLIETMLWTKKTGYFLLGLHLKRLLGSSEYFSFAIDTQSIKAKLEKLASGFDRGSNYRVRLVLGKNGETEINCDKIDLTDKNAKVGFSEKKVNTKDIFLYHKTTNRDLYASEYERRRHKGYADVIFTNERNQVTEGAISNIIIKNKGRYYTPPLECGLLNGVYRQFLMNSKGFNLKEKILYKKDLYEAGHVYIANSVRGLVEVCF